MLNLNNIKNNVKNFLKINMKLVNFICDKYPSFKLFLYIRIVVYLCAPIIWFNGDYIDIRVVKHYTLLLYYLLLINVIWFVFMKKGFRDDNGIECSLFILIFESFIFVIIFNIPFFDDNLGAAIIDLICYIGETIEYIKEYLRK